MDKPQDTTTSHSNSSSPTTPVAKTNRAPLFLALAGAVLAVFLLRNVPEGPVATVTPADRATVADKASALALPAATAATTAPTPPLGKAVPSTLSAAQKLEFEALIKDYLMRNPEVMLEVQSALEAKMEKVNAEKMSVALKENAKEIFQSQGTPVAGNAKGDITVVEFFDYNCGYCKKALPDLAAVLQADKNVRVVMKEFPILSKGSEETAKVALAAKLQGKYWEFHTAMLTTPGQATEAAALKVAEKVGCDMAKIKKDMASAEVKKEIDDTRNLAQKMGITGTPHFLVGDKVIAGAPENLTETINNHISELRKAGGCKVCGG